MITGSVKDSVGVGIQGIVMVMCTDDDTQELNRTVTDSNGDYVFECFTPTPRLVRALNPNLTKNHKIRRGLVPVPV